MKILVTGGAGFIGSNLVDRLIEIGHDVVIVDNLLTGSINNVNKKATFYELDIANKEALDLVFDKEKPELVFHTAAGYLVQSLTNPQRDAITNIVGTINVCESSLKHKVKKVIYSNSGGASYGEPDHIPIKEHHPMRPPNPYGISKHTGEHYLEMYKKNFGLKFTSLRYANIYGPRQNPKLEGGVIAVFLDALLKGQSPEMKSDGTPTRDYCYVSDVVDANLAVIDKGDGECYNVATAIETSVLDLYRTMQRVLDTDIEFHRGAPRIGDAQRAALDIEKIQKEIGWSPKINLEEGIKKTAEWMKTQ